MNFKKYHVSRNLCNPIPYKARYAISAEGVESANALFDIYSVTASASTEYSISVNIALSGNNVRVHAYNNGTWNEQIIGKSSQNLPFSFTTPANCDEIRISITHGALNHIMLNTGSTPQPYEPYSSEVWHDIPYYQHKTATDTLTLPAVIYPNDTSITVGLKGQSSQASTPSPSNPVDVVGVGELETSGEHSGQYKIPILNGSTTTPVYLGEVQTTRKIKKLVLDGTENWALEYTDNFLLNTPIVDAEPLQLVVCTHQQSISTGYESDTNFENVRISQTKKLNFRTRTIPHNLSDFKSYLAQQYANGTPVTVWYVLATPETAVVNEPLMKIGTYADSLTTSIPCTAGSNTLDVQTTVQPSEVAAGFSGWHSITEVHERENGQWD